jgi:hypothetical protein
VNVVAVDWRAGSSTYTEGLAQAKQCGEKIAEFINIMYESFTISPSTVRVVGGGLGGHIAGIAARNVKAKIPHIIGKIFVHKI